MSVLPGHEDLKRREVLNLRAVVNVGDSTQEYKLFVDPGGSIKAEPIQPPVVDQVAAPQKTPVSQRWTLVDQSPQQQ